MDVFERRPELHLGYLHVSRLTIAPVGIRFTAQFGDVRPLGAAVPFACAVAQLFVRLDNMNFYLGGL